MGCALDLRIHTNGVRLTEEFRELLDELGIKVGISPDGDRAANDRHRHHAHDHLVGIGRGEAPGGPGRATG